MAAELPLWVDPYPRRRTSAAVPRSAAQRGIAGMLAPLARRAEVHRADMLVRMAMQGARRQGEGALMARAVTAFSVEPDPLTLRAAALIARGVMVDCAEAERADRALAVAAATLAMRRSPVHLATVSPTDAATFHARFGAGFRSLGLTAASIGPDTALEQRRHAYSSAVTIVPIESLAEDALRDRRLFGRRRGLALKTRRLVRPRREPLIPAFRTLLCRGAETILLDDALRQVVLRSHDGFADSAAAIREAVALARRLTAEHYVLGERAELTETGRARLSAVAHLYPSLAPDTGSGRLMICEALAAIAAAPRAASDDGSLCLYERMLEGREPGAASAVEEQDHILGILGAYQTITGQGAGVSRAASELRDLYGVRLTVRIGEAARRIRVHVRPGLREARELLLRRFLAIRARGAAPVLVLGAGGLNEELPSELSDAPRLTPGDATDRPILVWGALPARRMLACAVGASTVEQVVPLEGRVPPLVLRVLSLVPTAALRSLTSAAVQRILRRTEERRRALQRRALKSYAARLDRLISFAGDAE